MSWPKGEQRDASASLFNFIAKTMLKKQHRLAKTKEIKAVFERGRGFFNPNFSLKHNPERLAGARFTVVVSTRVSKNATQRNRLKRLIREFIRLHLKNFRPGDYVVSLRPQALNLAGKELVLSLEKLLIQAKIYEKQPS